MFESTALPQRVAHKSIALYAGVVVLGALAAYAIHEHRAASNLEAQNAQATATLSTTQHQLGDLAAKVNMLAAQNQAQAAAQARQPTQVSASSHHSGAARRPVEDSRFKKLQAQLDAQGKAIDDTRNGLATTQGDLVSARTELSGSIAHTHDELVLLEKKGERNYAEFDLPKAKEFKRAGIVELRLKKANGKHQYADLEMMVNDRNLSQKHVNLFQPVMFYMPDSPQPVEIVINDIGKDHIHGYVSSSKYRQSDLASMSNTTDNPAQDSNQANAHANPNDQPTQRKRLPLPQ